MDQTIGVRRQLTLFVPHDAAAVIEAVRQRVDPVQYGLIGAHVTLCREDEIADLTVPVLRNRLARAARPPLTLIFGPPTPFANHGMLLPCVVGADAFHDLRVAVLDRPAIRPSDAHLTVAHPRNPRAADNVAATYAALPTPMTITFAAVALIEQRDAEPWIVRATMPLDGRAPLAELGQP